MSPIRVIDTIKPNGIPLGESLFPTVEDIDTLGGFQVQASLVSMYAIPTGNQKIGMLVYVIATETFYQLISIGSGAGNWAAANFAGDVSLAGDVTGAAGSNTVAKIQGTVISGTPSTGKILIATSGSAASWQVNNALVSWANDLSSSTNSNQYIGSISGSNGTGGQVPLNINSLAFSATQTSPSIIQSSLSSVSSGAGAAGKTFSLSSQNGQTTTASAQNGGHGGAVIISSGNGGNAGAGGTSGTGGSVVVEAGNGGTTNGAGGGVTLTGGSGSGASSGGNIDLIAGASGTGTGGSVIVLAGAPSSGSNYGVVVFGSNTSQIQISHTNITIPTLGGFGDGYVAVDNSGNLFWSAIAPSSSFVASGDLSGSSSAQEVIGLLNHALPSLTDGYLNWTGSAWALSAIAGGGGGSPTGSAGGDLGGTYPDPSVVALQGNPVESGILGSAEDGYVLAWDNAATQWRPSAIKNGFGAYTSRPAPGNAGATYIASDGIVSFVDDGTEWRPMIQGVVGWEVAPNNSSADWTQVGFAPTTVNIEGGCIYVYCDNEGSNSLSGYEQTKTAGQSVIAHILPFAQPQPNSGFTSSVSQAAIWVRDTSSGNLEGIFFGKDGYADNYNYISLNTYSTLSTFNASTSGGILPFSHGIWLRIDDTGSENKFSWSQDGKNWALYGTGTYVPSQGNVYGFGVNANGYDAALTVQSFRVAFLVVEPTFSLATPNIGSSAGGWSLALTGTGFQTGATVKINGVSCTSVVVNSPTSITCIAAAYSTPNGNTVGQTITITNTDGGTVSSSGTSTEYFYLPSNNPIVFAHRADVGLSQSGGNVTTWNDMTTDGYNWIVSTFPVAPTPTIGSNFQGTGLPYIITDGSTQVLQITLPPDTVPSGLITMFSVGGFSSVVATTLQCGLSLGSMDASPGIYSYITMSTFSGEFYAYAQSANIEPAPTDTANHVFTFYTSSDNTATMSIDATSASGAAVPQSFGNTVGLGAISYNGGVAQFPYNFYAPLNYLGDILYSGTLSGGDITTVQSILTTTSGL